MIPEKATELNRSINDLTRSIKQEALRLGFLAVGMAPATALKARSQELSRWVVQGFSGKMQYMEDFFNRQERFLASLPEVKSIVVLVCPYGNSSSAPAPRSGRVARYAQGRDYHRAIRKRLKKLEAFLRNETGDSAHFFHTVDTSPVQERVLAEAAGLGFFGKNTCLILPRGGSFVFLATVFTDLELTPDRPISWDCGGCSLCLEACPTQALVKPYELDANRCISYLTIEHRGAIDPALRPHIGDWLFGCDICQEVCPYNRPHTSRDARGQEISPWPEFQPEAGAGGSLPLADALSCQTHEQFLAKFAGTPLMRAKREGLLRNAAVVAGNLKDPELVPSLASALLDSSSQVREHAAWALRQINT